MALLKRILFPLLALVLTACPNGPVDREYEFEYENIIPDTPVNLEGINSRQDDYNSDLPYPYDRSVVYFSSNRGTYGRDYDIIVRKLGLSYHVKDDVLNVKYADPYNLDSYDIKLLDLIKSSDDQLGPLSLYGPEEYSYFFYADNQNGDYDICFTHHLKTDFYTPSSPEIINGPDTLMPVNSDKDDLYPSFMEDLTKLFFCSNRENEHFNIYSMQLPGPAGLHDFLSSDEPGEAVLISELSSESNDKCPYIHADIMVFVSDREGGYGGFDLYFSIFEDGVWSAPANFGPKINTEYDEYRPIIFSFEEVQKNLMIFSSDRPGGLGGFDLYMVQADGYIQSLLH